ncbi:MAG: hypothetical protein AVDCRST_MAG93-5875, partial [uncultured Chloroflexia bacterium]
MGITGDAMAANEVIAGLDIGGTKMLGVLIDTHGTIQTRMRRPTTMRGDTAVRDSVIDMLGALIEAGREQGLSTVGIGVGSPGYVDTEHGVIVDATNLAVLNLPLAPIISETFGLNAIVMHDVKAAALAEAHLGAGAGARHVAFLNIGTGIAVGLILDGRVFQGAGSRAGEIGHVVMVPDGPPCPCGLRGCLEMLAAGPAIARIARERVRSYPGSLIGTLVEGDHDAITAEIVAEAARQNDALAVEVIAQAANYVGLAIAGMINVLDLEYVIVGGGMAQMGELLLGPIRTATQRYALSEYRDPVPI